MNATKPIRKYLFTAAGLTLLAASVQAAPAAPRTDAVLAPEGDDLIALREIAAEELSPAEKAELRGEGLRKWLRKNHLRLFCKKHVEGNRVTYMCHFE